MEAPNKQTRLEQAPTFLPAQITIR